MVHLNHRTTKPGQVSQRFPNMASRQRWPTSLLAASEKPSNLPWHPTSNEYTVRRFPPTAFTWCPKTRTTVGLHKPLRSPTTQQTPCPNSKSLARSNHHRTFPLLAWGSAPTRHQQDKSLASDKVSTLDLIFKFTCARSVPSCRNQQWGHRHREVTAQHADFTIPFIRLKRLEFPLTRPVLYLWECIDVRPLHERWTSLSAWAFA